MASLKFRRASGLRPIHPRTAVITPNTSVAIPSKRRKLKPEDRLQKFNALYNFVSPRLGYRPAIKTPQVRNSAWTHLMGLAANEEQLTQVAALFPKWKDSRRKFGAEVGEAFVRALCVVLALCLLTGVCL
jgi:hypothetical protein